MYVYLGTETVTLAEDIVGVFNLDACTVNKLTREFLKRAQSEKRTVEVSGELPKSLVVTAKDGVGTVYITGVAAATVRKRCGNATANLTTEL